MGEHFFNAYLKDDVQLEPSFLQFRAVNLQDMKTKGECMVEIVMNGILFHQIFRVVEDVGWDVICGNDFIHGNQLIINSRKETLELPDRREIPIRFKRELNRNLVKLCNSKIIPSKSVYQAIVQIENPQHEDLILYTPTKVQIQHGVFIQPGITDKDGLTVMNIINNNRHSVKVSRGIVIGVTEAVESVQTVRKTASVDVNQNLILKEENADIYKQIDDLEK